MIRAMQTAGVLALAVACGVVLLCMRGWRRVPPPVTTDSIVQTFKDGRGRSADNREETASPLVAQAEAFGLFLNPAPLVKRPAPPARKERSAVPAGVPKVRPVAATPKFKLIGTSCSEMRPERSLALIVESGSNEARWVREGEQLGHFTIHEIKPGVVVYLADEKLSEMALDCEAEPTAVVASSDPGSLAAADSAPSARSVRSSGRPRTTRALTVGSVRTAALD